MTRSSTGDTAAFGELYGRYHDRAFRLARSVCHDDGRAEDAVQEAFLAIWKRSGSYSALRGSVAAWVLSVVRYRAIDVVRRQGKVVTFQAEGDGPDVRDGVHDADHMIIQREERLRIQALLRCLPDAQHSVIRLAFYAQLSHTEIAEHLGVPLGTVKGRLRLGMEKLRVELAMSEA